MSKKSSAAYSRPRAVYSRPSSIEPYFLYAIFVGVGLGSLLLDQSARLALLWTALVLLSAFYRGNHDIETDFTLASVGRGALLGLVISVPILAFLSTQLRLFAERLYATNDIVLLFYQVCFISAPVEEYFFRGIIQDSKGATAGIALYALTALLYFLPHAPLLIVLIIFAAMAILGIVYSYVRERYGLFASIACHVAAAGILLVAPTFIETIRAMLST